MIELVWYARTGRFPPVAVMLGAWAVRVPAYALVFGFWR